jgi:hypothetical protein
MHAEEPLQVQWNDVCKVANHNELNIKTASGDDVKGYCVSIGVDEISVRTADGKVVKLARTALDKIRLHRVKSHQLRELRRGLHETLKGSFALLFSPLAPAGIVAVPGMIAWGAIAAPFCAISDLHDVLQGTREIKVM